MKLKSILVIFTFLIVICVSLSAVIASSDNIGVSDADDDGNNTLKNSKDIMTKKSTLNNNLENKNIENNGGTVSNDGESNSTDTSFTQLANDIKNNV